MIPEKWDSIYLYASVVEKINHLETGEMFFYYIPKGILRKNAVNSYEIPSKFNIDEEEYIKLAENLYGYIKQLREEFQKAKEKLWTSLTIKVENTNFVVEFHYDNCNMDEEETHLIWCYKNLKIPLETYTKKEKEIIMKYLQEQELKPSEIQIYFEPMYHNPIKNVVQYNHENSLPKQQLETSKEDNISITRYSGKEKAKEYHALPENYTYEKAKNKTLRKTKQAQIKKVEASKEAELNIEEQIEMQKTAIKSQILNHF